MFNGAQKKERHRAITNGGGIMARFEREQKLLTYWSDIKINGEYVNGYAPESNLCILNSSGARSRGASRPLYAGKINDNIVMDVDRALGAYLSPLDTLRAVIIFAPGKYTYEMRRDAIGVQKTKYYQIQHMALLAALCVK